VMRLAASLLSIVLNTLFLSFFSDGLSGFRKIRQKRSSMILLERKSRDCFTSQLLQKILTDEYGFVYREKRESGDKIAQSKQIRFFKMSFSWWKFVARFQKD